MLESIESLHAKIDKCTRIIRENLEAIESREMCMDDARSGIHNEYIEKLRSDGVDNVLLSLALEINYYKSIIDDAKREIRRLLDIIWRAEH